MTPKTPEKQLSDKDTLETLLTSLEQAIEAKKQNDESIANIRESLAGRIEEMQQAKAMVDKVLERPATVPPSSSKPSWSLTVSLWSIRDFLWQWVIPAAVMFIALWLVMWALQSQTEEGNVRWEMPSLIETAHACILSDRILERRANRVETLPQEPTAFEDCLENPSIAELPEITENPSVEESGTVSLRQQIRRPFLRNLFNKLPCRT